MEILHVGKFYPPHRGGMETALRDLAGLGEELGHSVQCVVARRFGGPPPEVSNFPVITYPSRREIFSAPLPWKMLKHDFAGVEVLHLHLPNPLAELALTFRRPRLKIIPFVHALPVRQGWLGKFWQRLFTLPLLERSHLILISNFQMFEAFPALKAWQEKTKVLPFFAPRLPANELAEVFNARAQSRTILAVGRLVSYKGFDVLLKAWRQACGRSSAASEWKIEIIGEGREKNRLEQLIHDLDLSSQVFLLGERTEAEKQSALRKAAIFVAPSTSSAETFGIAILEAMAYALPVVTTDLPTGLKNLSREGACGAQALAGDTDSLTHALIRLIEMTPQARQNFGRANYDFQLRHYSEDLSREIYNSCLYSR